MVERALAVDVAKVAPPAMINLRVAGGHANGLHEIADVLGINDLPKTNRVRLTSEWSVAGLGPDEWLLMAEGKGAGEGAALEEMLRSKLVSLTISICDVSAVRGLVRLSGTAVWTLLAKGCSIPRQALGPDRCAQTLVAHLPTLIMSGGAQRIDLYPRTSAADYLLDWLVRAAACGDN